MKKLYTLLFITLCFSSLTLTAQPGYINTIAGNGSIGFAGDNMAATTAEFEFPSGIAVDTNGNYYICDQNNERIRKVNASTGIITTIAGNGSFGYSGDGGPATSADLLDPFVIAVDDSANVFFSDHANNRIREIVASTGFIYTVAGDSGTGFTGDGGPATSAEINTPNGVAVDKKGNIFFVDGSNERVREVYRSSGIINTVAGNGVSSFSGDGGPATSAELNGEWGVAVDDSDNIYISDGNNNRVRKVESSSGIINTYAGNGIGAFSGDGGPATSAELYNMTGVFVDHQYNLYIADFSNERVRMVNSSGIITTIAGSGTSGFSGDGGPATAADLNFPCDVATDKTGNIYIADESNNRIRMVSGSITTGISLLNSGEVNIYPNPATDKVYVNLSSLKDKVTEVSLYSVDGEMLWNKITNGTSFLEIPTGNLGNGVYIIKMQGAESKPCIKKIEIMR